MTQFLGRNYRLTLRSGEDELVYEPPMQITFSVDCKFGTEGSIAEITLYGASDKTRRAIYNKFDQVTLSAGYGNQPGLIFSGGVVNFEIGREGVDSYIKFYCRTAAAKQADGFISKTWGENTPQADIIREVAEAMLLPVEFVGDFSSLPKAIKGRSVCTSATACMNELARTHGFTWYMSGTRLTIIKLDENGRPASRQSPPHIVSAETGMIGSPQIMPQQIEVSKKLDPAIMPGERIDLRANTRNFAFSGVYSAEMMEADPTGGSGIYGVMNVRHEGDFHGDTWNTSIEGYRQA